ncbi:hypothetical protein N665_0540s0003 [Sinapis alba]|nr:hypothetical protein N665_0540s0003 [Sinapis alba]
MSAPESPVVPVAEPASSKDGPVKQVKASWAKVVENGPSLSEHVLEIGFSDGKEVVEVPDDVIANSVPLWDDLLEGRFLAKAPHVARIHYIVNRIWPLGDKSIKIDVYEVNDVTVKFRIKDEATRKRVLRRGMWNIANIPLVLSKWSPEDEGEEEEEITTIPMWIVMKNVPRRMFSWEGLGFIASAVGKPKRLHPDTLLCNSFEEAKVFVEANMTKELPTHHRFKSKLGVDAEVEFVYPWLPDRCTVCSKWGHLYTACRSKVKILSKDKPQRDLVEKSGQASTKERDLVNTEIITVSQEVEDMAALITTENVMVSDVVVGNKDGVTEQFTTQANGEESEKIPATRIENDLRPEVVYKSGEGEEQEISGWLSVSPTKTGRSGNKEVILNHNLSSPSRFAVLSMEDPVEEVDENEANGAGKETEEGEIIPEEEIPAPDESREESEVNSHDIKENDTVKEKVGVREERLLRSTIPRPTRGSTKTQSDTRSISTKDTVQSTGGRKKNSKKH